MNEINVVLVDLPPGAKGCVVPEADGSYTVYINARYNAEQQTDIYNHEMKHLLLGHYEAQAKTIAEIENEASTPGLLQSKIEQYSRYGFIPFPRPAAALPSADLPRPPPAEATFALEDDLLQAWFDRTEAIQRRREFFSDYSEQYEDLMQYYG